MIDGADQSYYKLGNQDVGKIIIVKLNYTDEKGNSQTLTSNQIGPVISLLQNHEVYNYSNILNGPAYLNNLDLGIKGSDERSIEMSIRLTPEQHKTGQAPWKNLLFWGGTQLIDEILQLLSRLDEIPFSYKQLRMFMDRYLDEQKELKKKN